MAWGSRGKAKGAGVSPGSQSVEPEAHWEEAGWQETPGGQASGGEAHDEAEWPDAAARSSPAPPAATDGLELLVQGLFDYAGMFPPASLELDGALWESARSPRLHRPHLVGSDLVVSLDDLGRLDEERLRMAGFGDTEAKVAVVGVEADGLAKVPRAVAVANNPGVLRVVSLEVHGTSFPLAPLQACAREVPGVQLFIEPRMPDDAWARNHSGVLGLLDRLEANDLSVGLKVRGSGSLAVSPRTLGILIPRMAALGLPFKATAGLHHPIVEPAYNNRLGFLGLAAAVRLRYALGEAFTAADIERCVAESQSGAFSFDGELAWHAHAINVATLAEAKMQHFSIGSCSLKEPDDDLARLFG